MPRPCSICVHEKRDEIEVAIVRGDTYRLISHAYSVSPDAVKRHKLNGHIRTEVVEVPASNVEIVHTVDPLNELERYKGMVEELLSEDWKIRKNPLFREEIRKDFRLLFDALKVRVFVQEKSPNEHREIDLRASAHLIMECMRPFPEAYQALSDLLDREVGNE